MCKTGYNGERTEYHVHFDEYVWRDGEWHKIEPKPPPDPEAFVRLDGEGEQVTPPASPQSARHQAP